ncbi:MAG: NADH-quinone oxidoreductase subunit N [Candidatus Dormibacteraeota bacterium]|nr:NADH-quinone oxidoreductase subunit N [Candidatus Dormibacteraeota bacterium]
MAVMLGAAVTYSWSQAGSDLGQISPIVVVSLTLLVAMVTDLLLPRILRARAAAVISLLGLVGAIAAAVLLYQSRGHDAYSHFATGDDFAVYFHVLFALLGIMTIVVTHPYLARRNLLQPEFYILLLAATDGMMVMGAATSLVSVFLGLELLSISLYVMAGYVRRDTRSQEAGVKYLLIGGFASAFVLYGMALVYGATGSTVLARIAAASGSDTGSNLLILGVLLMGIGFAFKVSAAPFQMWTPDVYEGSPIPVTAFMSVGTKAAAFAMIIRVFQQGLPGLSQDWGAFLAFVAVASMVIGNLAAIVQTSLKRLLAYSGIAQAGYILVGVLGSHGAGQAAVLFYLFAYLFMNFGAFAILIVMAGPLGDRDRFEDLDGLGYRHPVLAGIMTVFMFSLAGFPPTVGFIGKFFLFSAAVANGYTWLVVIAVLMSVVSVYYYFRVVVHVWTRPAAEGIRFHVPAGAILVVGVSGVLALVLGILPSLLYGVAQLGASPVAAAGH